MGIASFERFNQVGFSAAEGFMMTLGEVAPGRFTERAVESVAVFAPSEGAMIGLNEDGAHRFSNHAIMVIL
jgi:hypothetical protein